MNEPEVDEDADYKLILDVQMTGDLIAEPDDISVALIEFYSGAPIRFAGNSLERPFKSQAGQDNTSLTCVEDFPAATELSTPLWYIIGRTGVRAE